MNNPLLKRADEKSDFDRCVTLLKRRGCWPEGSLGPSKRWDFQCPDIWYCSRIILQGPGPRFDAFSWSAHTWGSHGQFEMLASGWDYLSLSEYIAEQIIGEDTDDNGTDNTR